MSSFDIGLSALKASQRGIDLAGQNLANATTPGYHRQDDATRTLIDAGRPLHARTRVRFAARQTVVAVVWLSVALYGLYLATVGVAVRT